MASLLRFKTHAEAKAIKCSKCDKEGHEAASCNANRTCTNCLDEGHIAFDCPFSRDAARVMQPKVYVAGKGFVTKDMASRDVPFDPPPRNSVTFAVKRLRAGESHPSLPSKFSKPALPPCPWLTSSAGSAVSAVTIRPSVFVPSATDLLFNPSLRDEQPGPLITSAAPAAASKVEFASAITSSAVVASAAPGAAAGLPLRRPLVALEDDPEDAGDGDVKAAPNAGRESGSAGGGCGVSSATRTTSDKAGEDRSEATSESDVGESDAGVVVSNRPLQLLSGYADDDDL